MGDTQALLSAKASGTFEIGGDLPVGRLGFGAMRITGAGIWGEPADPDECRRVLRRAVELGVTLIDTADSYGPHVSERLIARGALAVPGRSRGRHQGGLTRTGPNRWSTDGRPEHLRAGLRGQPARGSGSIASISSSCTGSTASAAGPVSARWPTSSARARSATSASRARVDEILAARELSTSSPCRTASTCRPRRRGRARLLRGRGIGFMPWFPLATGR